MGRMLTLRNQVCVYALCEVQTGSGPGCLQTRRPCQKIRGENRLGCRLEPERQKENLSLTGMCRQLQQTYPTLLEAQKLHRSTSDGSDLHVKQIELDRVSGVHVLVGVEELASEQKGLVLVHPLLSERSAVVQPVH